MRFLIVHPSADYSTADVWRGLSEGLAANGHSVKTFELGSHLIMAGAALTEAWDSVGREDEPSQADVTLYAGHAVYLAAVANDVDAVIVVTAQFWHPDHTIALRKLGYPVGVLLTESPYMDQYMAESSMVADVVWTNERTSVPYLQRGAQDMARAGFWATDPDFVRYLPAAWNPAKHNPDTAAELGAERNVASHDVVFVGSGYAERIATLEGAHDAGAFRGLDFGLYGDWPYLFPPWVPPTLVHKSRLPAPIVWGLGRTLARVGLASPLFRYVRAGVIHNDITTGLYSRASIGLNLFRTSVRYSRESGAAVHHGESMGPRVFELAATGTFIISEHRAEIADVFGAMIPTFRTPVELARLVQEWSGPERDMERRSVGLRLAETAAEHSWKVRAAQVVDDLRRAVIRRGAQDAAPVPKD